MNYLLNFYKDSDNDGLTDFEEVNDYATDSLNTDTDGDGLLGGEEVERYTIVLKMLKSGDKALKRVEIKLQEKNTKTKRVLLFTK